MTMSDDTKIVTRTLSMYCVCAGCDHRIRESEGQKGHFWYVNLETDQETGPYHKACIDHLKKHAILTTYDHERGGPVDWDVYRGQYIDFRLRHIMAPSRLAELMEPR